MNGPAGTGPLTLVTNAAPVVATADGIMPVTSASPSFVSVSDTVKYWPVEANAGAAARAASTPGVWIESGPAEAGPLVIVNPEFTSIPVTVVVRITGPDDTPV